MSKPQTAKEQLGLDDLRGDYLQGNVESEVVSAVNRTQEDFENNKDPWPSGEPAPHPYYLQAR